MTVKVGVKSAPAVSTVPIAVPTTSLSNDSLSRYDHSNFKGLRALSGQAVVGSLGGEGGGLVVGGVEAAVAAVVVIFDKLLD